MEDWEKNEPRTARKRREALGRINHRRLFDCVNVNRTSLDHLLLGGVADIDRMSNELSITRNQNHREHARLAVRRSEPGFSSHRLLATASLRAYTGFSSTRLQKEIPPWNTPSS